MVCAKPCASPQDISSCSAKPESSRPVPPSALMLNTTHPMGALQGRGTAGSGTSLGRPGRAPPGQARHSGKNPNPKPKRAQAWPTPWGVLLPCQRRTALVELNVGSACRSCAAVSRNRAQVRGQLRCRGRCGSPGSLPHENTAGLCQSPKNEHIQSLDFDLEPPGHIICVFGLVSNVATPAA